MPSLEQRLQALETTLPPAEPTVLMRVIVAPGCVGAPLVRAETAAGVLLRAKDESEADFVQRIEAQARAATSAGAAVVSVIAYSTVDGEVRHAQP